MNSSVPVRLAPDDPRLPAVLALVQRCFAGMQGRVDPPSSMHRLTVEAIAEQARKGEVWICGDPPVACMFLSIRDGRLYLGKLSVDSTARGQGLARQLMDLAETRARALGLNEIEVKVRIELTENHATFTMLGFTIAHSGSHEGYDRPTYVVMRKPVGLA